VIDIGVDACLCIIFLAIHNTSRMGRRIFFFPPLGRVLGVGNAMVSMFVKCDCQSCVRVRCFSLLCFVLVALFLCVVFAYVLFVFLPSSLNRWKPDDTLEDVFDKSAHIVGGARRSLPTTSSLEPAKSDFTTHTYTTHTHDTTHTPQTYTTQCLHRLSARSLRE